MRNRTTTVIVTAFLVIIVAMVVFFFSVRSFSSSENSFIRGKHGRYCYQIDNYPKNIRYFVYFDSYDECEKSLSS